MEVRIMAESGLGFGLMFGLGSWLGLGSGLTVGDIAQQLAQGLGMQRITDAR